MRSPLDWSRKTKAIVAVVLAFVLWLPQGVSTEQQPIVTGHSTFYNGDVYDKCLASVAGILRSRVMWFNDMVLAERYGGKGTFVYITEEGAPDPTKEQVLLSEGVFFDFVDPNGAQWHVEEAYIDYGGSTTYPGVNNADEWAAGAIDSTDEGGPVQEEKYYVWFVELAERPIYDEFNDHKSVNDPNFHTFYNFLVLVDTCKFHNNTKTYREYEDHTGLEPGHEPDANDHYHDSWNANVWVGTRPVVLPARPADNALEWQTQWATSGGPERDSQRALNKTDDYTE